MVQMLLGFALLFGVMFYALGLKAAIIIATIFISIVLIVNGVEKIG